MRGIAEEVLINELNKHVPHSEIGTLLYLLIERECRELNPWRPIESAPLNKKLRLFKITGQYQCDDTLYGEEFRAYYSHWQELPEDPK